MFQILSFRSTSLQVTETCLFVFVKFLQLKMRKKNEIFLTLPLQVEMLQRILRYLFSLFRHSFVRDHKQLVRKVVKKFLRK